MDFADRQFWITDLKSTWNGDANIDGEFNRTDFVEVFRTAKYESGETARWDQGDWNGDALFNSSDLVVAFLDGGYELGPRPAVSAVPETSSWVLVMSGLLAISRRRRIL